MFCSVRCRVLHVSVWVFIDHYVTLHLLALYDYGNCVTQIRSNYIMLILKDQNQMALQIECFKSMKAHHSTSTSLSWLKVATAPLWFLFLSNSKFLFAWHSMWVSNWWHGYICHVLTIMAVALNESDRSHESVPFHLQCVNESLIH